MRTILGVLLLVAAISAVPLYAELLHLPIALVLLIAVPSWAIWTTLR